MTERRGRARRSPWIVASALIGVVVLTTVGAVMFVTRSPYSPYSPYNPFPIEDVSVVCGHSPIRDFRTPLPPQGPDGIAADMSGFCNEAARDQVLAAGMIWLGVTLLAVAAAVFLFRRRRRL